MADDAPDDAALLRQRGELDGERVEHGDGARLVGVRLELAGGEQGAVAGGDGGHRFLPRTGRGTAREARGGGVARD